MQFSARYKTVGSMAIPEGAETEVLGDAHSGYIVNVAREIGEEAVRVPRSISAKLKVHQVGIYICASLAEPKLSSYHTSISLVTCTSGH